MWNWLSTPRFEDEETSRQAQMLWRVLAAMTGLVGLGLTVGLASEGNDVGVTLFFYGLVFAWFGVVAAFVRWGRVVLAAWIFSLFFWGLIAAVTLLFGGLQGQNASTFAVCTLLIGSIVGGRAALGMALASSLWAVLVWQLEARGALPPQLGPYTPANAWASLTITVTLTAVLLHESLKSLRGLHQRAQQAAAERDEALRDSVQRQKMELVGNLTSGVAHDLNNLLTVIMGTVELLRDSQLAKLPENEALLADLDDAASRSALMTTQLLAFGRAHSSKSEPTDVAAVLKACGRMTARIVGSNIDVNVEAAGDCWAMASRSALEQIVLNLVVNARDAMPDGGRLTLRVGEAGDQVEVAVTDTGGGIAPDVAARAFEPFFTTKDKGTGLGLATIQRLVSEYSGTITLESEVGTGTTFRVRLPKIAAPPGAAPASLQEVSEEAGLQTGRLLLVEDDPMVRKALGQVLLREGFEVTAVSDGDEALALLPVLERFDCVVTDISMQRVDGDELAERLQTTHPKLPVVIISGNREPRAPAPEQPRVFLQKPVEYDDLRRAIRHVTRGG